MPDFRRTLNKYLEVSKKTVEQVVLNKSFDLALAALKNTKFADAGKIAHELSQSVKSTFSTDVKGRWRVRRRLNFGLGDKNTLAARLVNSRRKALGQPPLWGRYLTD